MAAKITEFEINQIIIEETKAVVKESDVLQENPLALRGLMALGSRAVSSAWGSNLAAGLRGIFFGTKKRAVFSTIAGLQAGQEFMQMGENPDTEVIIKLIPEDSSKELKAAMENYGKAYAEFLDESANTMFLATDFFSKAKEWVPSLGLDRVLSGTDYAATATIDYTPNNPSTEAIGRRQTFASAVNEIVIANNPIQPGALNAESLRAPLASLTKEMVAREFKIGRQSNLEDRFLIKSESKTETFLLGLLDKMVKAAVAANSVTTQGIERARQETAKKAEEEGASPEEASEKAEKAVTVAASPTYRITPVTQAALLRGEGVLKKFDRSITRPGEQEDIIRSIQGMLQTTGILIGKDGYFGPVTEKAVKDFQAANRLESTGQVDQETYSRLIEKSVDKELEDAADGDLPPTEADKAGQQTESGADNALPFKALVKKIERLQKLERETNSSKVEARVRGRIERAKKRLETRAARRLEREKRRARTLQETTNLNIEEIIKEEVEAVLSENITHQRGMPKYSFFKIQRPPEGSPNTKTFVFQKWWADNVAPLMNAYKDNNAVQLAKRIHDSTASIFGTKEGPLAAAITQAYLKGILQDVEKSYLARSKDTTGNKYESIAKVIFGELSGVTGEDPILRQVLYDIIKGRSGIGVEWNPYTGKAVDRLGTSEVPDTRTSDPSAPDTRTSDYASGKDIDVPSGPRVSTGGTKAVATPSSSSEGIPADWRRFAEPGGARAEMARAWIAATSRGNVVTEAALPLGDSSYKAFQKWYAETARELGRQFGPTEAIKLINKAKKASKAPAKTPETPAKTPETPKQTQTREKEQSRADKNIAFYSKRVKAADGALGAMLIQLSNLRNDLPPRTSFESTGQLAKVRGSGPKRKAYNDYIDEIEKVIAGRERDQKGLETAQDYKAALPDRVKELTESTKSRWQKIIKG